MLISDKVYNKIFIDKTTKGAYLKACSWVGKNLLGKLKKYPMINLQWEMKIIEEGKVELVVYNIVSINSEKGKFCKVCKDYHKAFFINESYNCSRCNMITFVKRLEERVKISSKFSVEKIFKD